VTNLGVDMFNILGQKPFPVGGLEHEFYFPLHEWDDELIFFRGVGIPPTRFLRSNPFLHSQESGGFFISTGGGGLNLPLDDDDDAFKASLHGLPEAAVVFFFKQNKRNFLQGKLLELK